jgi:hypothetical protein
MTETNIFADASPLTECTTEVHASTYSETVLAFKPPQGLERFKSMTI